MKAYGHCGINKQPSETGTPVPLNDKIQNILRMKTDNINLVYFSATYTTRKVVRAVAECFKGNITEYDITVSEPEDDITMADKDELLIVGVPVYAGRVPVMAVDALRRFHGQGTPAIAVCVYGNRAYDDALLELCDLLAENGFKTVAAGAFVARHSIFTTIASNRPDKADMAAIKRFGDECARLIAAIDTTEGLTPPTVPGNRPYKTPGAIPLYPSGSRKKCTRCNTCVRNCPVHAISEKNPTRTDGKLCISCGRCVEICPKHTRCFSGLLYTMARRKLSRMCKERREPEYYLAK